MWRALFWLLLLIVYAVAVIVFGGPVLLWSAIIGGTVLLDEARFRYLNFKARLEEAERAIEVTARRVGRLEQRARSRGWFDHRSSDHAS